MEQKGLNNSTPFAADQLLLRDENGRDILVVVIKAAFDIIETTKLDISEIQIPVNFIGEYNGVPGESSFKYEPEVAPVKLSTDVVLIGHAYPEKKNATQVDVTLRVGTIIKTVRVFGNRNWKKLFGFKFKTSASPFEKIPLVYELAYGGYDRSHPNPTKHKIYQNNPVGKGYGKFVNGMSLPNIEEPKKLIKKFRNKPYPAGFGFIGPEWAPRNKYVGTYDETWMKNTMPLLPDDFDRRHYNAAHPDLIANGYLQGNESVDLINASPKGRIRFMLPGLQPPSATVFMDDEESFNVGTNLDTVIINTDIDKVILIFRGLIEIHGRIYDIHSVKIQMNKNV